jgi:hypothetical protein
MTFFTHSRIAKKIAVLAASLLISFPTFAQNEHNNLNQKLLMGYQGWFLAAGDNSPPNEWRHWFNSLTDPSAANLNIDMWPDMREYTQTYPTNMTYGDGSSARLFSSYDESTVMTHFKWMKDYGIHGVYLQRFLGEAVNDPRFFQVRNKVLQNVMTAAQTHDRQFAVMYDLSGVPDDGNLYNKLINDWEYLVQNYQMTTQGTYLKQENLPVIALWGIGFNKRGLNPDTFAQIIDYFQNSAPPAYRAYVVGGVPGEWRTLTGDSETDARWAEVYRSLDMISPWTVGRYTNNTEADNWKNQRIVPDMAAAAASGADYMPVIWPGFSWYNLHDGPLNQIPRNGGQFYWRQAYNALDAGAEFIYVAMFDEVDEATAMFKLAETSSDIPAQGNFVTLDADGTDLLSDWYLRLAGETQKILAGTTPLSATIPISPTDEPDVPVGEPKNPIIRHMFTADPSAHVWDDGRLYIYASHDIAPARGADLMDQYHVFSTDDMVNWVDHGEILRASDVPWGRPEGGFMWAPDAAYKDGTYYFYFPHPSGTDWNTTWKIGVATSSQPASGFVVQGYIPGLDALIDPAVFIDDDGQAYFYHGGGGVAKGGRLKDNMMEIDGQMQTMVGLEDFHEAAWVHKRNGLYYLSYSDNHDVGDQHNRMRYATSTSPLGPWTSRGIYMDPTDSYTNHGSIVEYKGQWYAFYHNSSLSGDDWLRSVAVDKLFYNADGTIRKVVQTKEHGTPYGGVARAIPGTIQAEDFDEGGQAVSYSDSDAENLGGAYRPNEAVDIAANAGGGHHVGWLGGSEWLEYTVDVASSGSYELELRVASESGSSVRMMVDGVDATGQVAVPATGAWQSYTTISTPITLTAGQHILQLRAGGAFNIDFMRFSSTGSDGQTPFGGTPWAIPGTIEMENFDNGGEGVAYHDADAANNGNAGRTNEGVDTENASGGGLNVGWTSSGEWLEYTVSVATSGTYDLEFRVASIVGGGNFHVQFDGEDKTGLIPTSNTGGWQTWTSVTAENVALDAGEQVMRVYLDNANFNLDKVIITPANPDVPDDDPVAYRIRNVWQNSYLGDGGATVTYSNSPNSANFEWQLEEVADGLQEIRNRATGDYMHIENLTGNIQCATRTSGWASARWHIADAGNGQVRIRNAWQSNDYIHVENLNGNAQHGGIYMEWSSAKWVLEVVED